VDKSVVFRQLLQREKNIYFKMESIYVCSNVYLIFGGIERKFSGFQAILNYLEY
jgi:hypothetical protein